MSKVLSCDMSVKTGQSANGKEYKFVEAVLPDGRVVKLFDKDLMNAVLLCLLGDV